jgi:hypothetical protein
MAPAAGIAAQEQQNEIIELKEPATRTVCASTALYAYQWAVLLLLCPPLLVLDLAAALPLAVVLLATGAVARGSRMAAERDPVLAKALGADDKGRRGLLGALLAFGRVYMSLASFGFHKILRLFGALARPRTVFVVYASNYRTLRKLFCVGTAELLHRAGLLTHTM